MFFCIHAIKGRLAYDFGGPVRIAKENILGKDE